MLHLPADQRLQPASQADRRDEKPPVGALVGVAGEVVEDVGGIRADGVIAGEKAEVGVVVRGHGVVVARGKMHVAPDAVALLPDDEGDLRVGLQPEQTVDHVHALAFQRAGPLDVALLVEARLQLHEHGHLLAAAHRFQESLHDRRVLADPVEGLLDGEHRGVPGRRVEKIDHGIEGIVGMVKEDVLAPDGAEDIALPVLQRRRERGHEGGYFSSGRSSAVQLIDVAHAQGRLHRVDVAGVDLEVFRQDVADGRRHRRVHGQPHDPAEPPLPHSLFDRLQEVFRFQLLDGHLRVPGHAERDGTG